MLGILMLASLKTYHTAKGNTAAVIDHRQMVPQFGIEFRDGDIGKSERV
jgi:hypothetical protein